MTDVRTDVHERDVLVASVRRQRRPDQLERLLRRVRFDVHDAGLQAGALGRRHPVLHFLLAGGGDQHLDLVGVVRCPAQDLEIEVDFIERERNVLVGLGLDGELELLLFLAGRDDNLLGDDHRGRECQRDVAVAAAEALGAPAEGIGDLLHVRDVAVHDDVLGQRLDRIALETERALAGIGKLDQLDRRRRDVDSDQ